MAKNKNKKGRTGSVAPSFGGVAGSIGSEIYGNTLVWTLLLITGIFLVYKPVFNYDMINWDEKRYLLETPFIFSFSAENVKAMFTEKVLASYNPLVLLSFAIDHKFAGNDWGWYHGVNVFFHILNACLLYFFLRRLPLNKGIAEFTSAIFAFHPASVEAVAWIAGRKDVLYVFFYLLSLIFYLNFRKEKRWVYYLLTVFCALCSSLSKVQAVTLPLALVLTDYLYEKRFRLNDLKNKIPFFVISLFTGLIALSGSSFVADKYSFQPTFIDKIVYSVMAMGLYVIKWFVPTGLSVIHDFPERYSSAYWILFSAAIILIISILLASIVTFNRKIGINAGLLFFIIHIFPVLHIVAYNSAIIYERFTYLAGIGLTLSLCALDELWPKWVHIRNKIVWPLTGLYIILTILRIPVWKNPETLWTDAIKKNPLAEQAFNNRGQYYDSQGEYDKMLADINSSIALSPSKPDAWNNKCVYYFRKKDWPEALASNDKVLAIDSNHTEGLSNRAGIFLNQQLYDSALFYYNRLIKANPKYAPAYHFSGAAYLKKKEYRKAADYLLLALSKTPSYPEACSFLAQAYAHLQMPDSVVAYASAADMQNPSLNAVAEAGMEYVRMGNEAFQSGNAPLALEYYLTGGKVNPNNAEAFYDAGGVCLTMKDVLRAREYWKKALQVNPNHQQAKEWLNKTGGLN